MPGFIAHTTGNDVTNGSLLFFHLCRRIHFSDSYFAVRNNAQQIDVLEKKSYVRILNDTTKTSLGEI